MSSSAPTTGHAEEVGSAQSMQTVLLRQFCYLYSHLACDAAHIDKCYTLQYKVLIRFVNGYCAYKPESLFHVIILLTLLFSSTSFKTYYIWVEEDTDLAPNLLFFPTVLLHRPKVCVT